MSARLFKDHVTISIRRWGYITKHYWVTIRGPGVDFTDKRCTASAAEALVRRTLAKRFPPDRFHYTGPLGNKIPDSWMPEAT